MSDSHILFYSDWSLFEKKESAPYENGKKVGFFSFNFPQMMMMKPARIYIDRYIIYTHTYTSFRRF